MSDNVSDSAPSWNKFQLAQRRLNLVKAHAHEIVGVKREQVSRVVENFSKPGTYVITVHENGQVTNHQWTPPNPDDLQVPAQFPVIDEDKAIDEVVEVMDEPLPQENSSVISEELSLTVPEDIISSPIPTPTEEPLGEAQQEEVSPAPEPAPAPRRRGRPKRSS